MNKPTPLTADIVSKLKQNTELWINNSKERAINYLATEWLEQQAKIRQLEDQIRQLMDLPMTQRGPTYQAPGRNRKR